MRRVAVVTPWFGARLHGGAERQAFEIAARLSSRSHAVEVLTTCCRSFSDEWSEEHYAPGVEIEDGLTVRRFPVDARDAETFDAVNARLLRVTREELKAGVSPVAVADARAFVEHNINSAPLLEHLQEVRDRFDAFIFLPYLYGTTLRGLPLVAPRALLQPCLHDEAYARLPIVAELFRRARRILFNSEGECELAHTLYGPGIHTRSRVVGEGVETELFDAQLRVEQQITDALPRGLRGARFVLYLGRRDATKNIDLLLDAYRRFRADFPATDLRLVVAGTGADSFDAPSEGVFDLGVVREETKNALLRAARALFQPSQNESYSRALMEAWLAARPVAAHRQCLATSRAVTQSGGGWLAATADEWARAFATVADASDEELAKLGARGRAYAREHADWDRVIDRYEIVFDELDENVASVEPATRSRQTSLRAVHQLLPDVVCGDAISNHALSLRDGLRAAGLISEVFAKRREAAMAEEARLFTGSEIEADAGLIYHHSIGSEVTAAATAHAGAKCLVYHNITPSEFYAPYRPGFAWLLETGRASLRRLARHFPCAVGDSAFNAAELAAQGFHAPGVLPVIVDPDRWNTEPDEALMRDLQDGRTNVLFVGRIAPNKRQDALVHVFAEYVRLDADARLVIAGEGRESDPYFQNLRRSVGRLGLAARVVVTGRITDAALLAYYRTAHLYLSPSEHEGFGVPLVETMWFDVPVLARGGTAVNSTLGDAGLVFDSDMDAPRVARLAYDLARGDASLRRRIIEAQRLRREAFTPAAVRPLLDDLVRHMETQRAPRAGVA
ncbi:MAG: hypothetical protein QOF61_609 [Acidobacteriota bacterium]|nr:hypothetical protein [Acidobacteriota bacterium]